MRKHVHFIGIGGISMSGLAEILHNKGWFVSGSDSKPSEITTRLEALGISVAIGQHARNITEDIDMVVFTAAVKPDNPELVEAHNKKLHIVDRAELLGNLMKDFGCPICVSGTHGKTSTTSMIAEILLTAEMDPTISVGGFLDSINGNFRIGKSPYFVVESCEYADSFLKFHPKIGVILNVDLDHLDYFSDLDGIEASFRRFSQNIPKEGTLIVYGDVSPKVTEGLDCSIITYGTKNSDIKAVNLNFDSDGYPSFSVQSGNELIGEVNLRVRGEHNVKNALAAFAASIAAGADQEAVLLGLSRFGGVKRRFEEKGAYKGVRVIDDYAHHPTEIKATLEAASKTSHNRVFCVFQPHTYTRTLALLNEFALCFENAHKVIVLDIYAAREKDTGIINSKILTDYIKAAGSDAVYCPTFQMAQNFLIEQCAPGDLCLTVGAGDVYLVGESLVSNRCG